MKMMKRLAAVVAAATVAAASVATMNFSASAADEIAQAYFIGQFGNETGNWSAGENSGCTTASITGDGQYTVEWNLTCDGGATETGNSWFLVVAINPTTTDPDTGKLVNFTTDTYPDLQVTLDEVWVNGSQVSGYSVSSNAIDTAYYEKDPGVTRIYLHDNWAGTGVTDLADGTIEGSVKAVFTISGTGQVADTTSSDNTGSDNTSNDATESTGSDNTSSDNTSSNSNSSNNTSSSSSNNSSSSGNSSSSNSSSSNSSSGTSSNDTTSQTGDFGIAAIVLGAVAAGALGVGAATVKKRKK